MKKIFKSSVLAFALAFMLNACGSDDSIKPVLYEMFDNYDYANYRQERRGIVIIEHQELGLMPTGQLPITIQITGLIYLFLLQAYRIPLSLIPTITKPMLIAVKAPG